MHMNKSLMESKTFKLVAQMRSNVKSRVRKVRCFCDLFMTCVFHRQRRMTVRSSDEDFNWNHVSRTYLVTNNQQPFLRSDAEAMMRTIHALSRRPT